MVNKALLDFLVCPKTKTPLVYDAHTERLISTEAQLAYPVRDGVPVLLPEAAIKL